MKSSDNRFLSKIAVLLVCLTALMLTVGCNNGTNVKWDYQADVVIIGAAALALNRSIATVLWRGVLSKGRVLARTWRR